jgi:hypothetical protein
VEVFLRVEDGDGVGMIKTVLLRRGVETVVVDPDITGIYCLHYIYDASFIFSAWRVPLTEGERMNAPTVFTKQN